MTETLGELWRKYPKHQLHHKQSPSGKGEGISVNRFEEKRNNIEAIPQDANHSSVVRIRKWDDNLQRRIFTEISHKISVLWTDETKINLYQSDGKAELWRKKGSAHDPKHTSSSVKHGGGSVMAWACMAASGVGSLILTDDITHDVCSRMNLQKSTEKCVQTKWEELHAARQWSKTHCQHNKGLH